MSEIQRRLTKSEALISFHTGEEKSYVWAITRNGFESQFCPGGGEIAAVAARFRKRLKGTATRGPNTKLYGMLFGGLLGHEIQSQSDWLLPSTRVSTTCHSQPWDRQGSRSFYSTRCVTSPAQRYSARLASFRKTRASSDAATPSTIRPIPAGKEIAPRRSSSLRV